MLCEYPVPITMFDKYTADTFCELAFKKPLIPLNKWRQRSVYLTVLGISLETACKDGLLDGIRFKCGTILYYPDFKKLENIIRIKFKKSIRDSLKEREEGKKKPVKKKFGASEA